PGSSIERGPVRPPSGKSPSEAIRRQPLSLSTVTEFSVKIDPSPTLSRTKLDRDHAGSEQNALHAIGAFNLASTGLCTGGESACRPSGLAFPLDGPEVHSGAAHYESWCEGPLRCARLGAKDLATKCLCEHRVRSRIQVNPCEEKIAIAIHHLD